LLLLLWRRICGEFSSSSATLPSTLQAEGQPLPPDLLLPQRQHKEYINLQFRRFACSTMLGSRCGDPSGHVPGVAAVVRCRRFSEQSGEGAGLGLDGVSCIRSEVLCVNLQDLDVFFFFFKVLFVICNSTALN
jgi:hypothetical protein